MIENVIYISGVPRSGTSWISQIINSSPAVRFRFQPLFSYEFKNVLNEDSSSIEINDFFEKVYECSTEYLTQSDKIKTGLYPDFKKSEETILAFKDNGYQTFIEPVLRKTEQTKFVGIIRNPNATLYSWTQNVKEFPEGSSIEKEWRFGNCKNNGNHDYFGYYKWKEVANLYLDLKQKYPDRVSIIHYDKFIQDVIGSIEELFKFLNLKVTGQTLDFISESNNKNHDNYYSVFKGAKKKDLWTSKLPKSIINEIEADLTGTRLEKFLS